LARDRVIQKRWGSGRRERRGGGKGLRVRARRAREKEREGGNQEDGNVSVGCEDCD